MKFCKFSEVFNLKFSFLSKFLQSCKVIGPLTMHMHHSGRQFPESYLALLENSEQNR